MENSPPDSDSLETCDAKIIHCNVVQAVKQRMPSGSDLEDMADFFKLFGDPTRIRILWALSESEMCVCDICALLKMKQPAVSHQLRTLKQARAVKARRDGKIVYYSLDDDHIRNLLGFSLDHIRESDHAEHRFHAKR